MTLEMVDLDAAVDAALVPFSRALSDARVEVIRPAPLGSAMSNREWVGEIFANLIGNAIKYNDKPVRWIEIGAEEGQPVRYYVRDNGIGIEAADQQLIFQMFRRVHQGEDFGGGTGIGLTLTRKIVERHGGRIWVRSEPGEGSSFYFTLAPGDEGDDRKAPASASSRV
jgi:signal transduction histidine kinase